MRKTQGVNFLGVPILGEYRWIWPLDDPNQGLGEHRWAVKSPKVFFLLCTCMLLFCPLESATFWPIIVWGLSSCCCSFRNNFHGGGLGWSAEWWEFLSVCKKARAQTMERPSIYDSDPALSSGWNQLHKWPMTPAGTPRGRRTTWPTLEKCRK